MIETPELKVFISNRNSTCDECHEDLGERAWICLAGERGAHCLSCADLEHLAFLPSGDAALTRRAKKNSRLWAVVLKWNRARKVYQRQGLLVDEAALAKAETECLADNDARRLQRERAAVIRAELDLEFVARFAERIVALFPGCPAERARTIAEHACLKYSGRVGRSAAAKELAEDAVRLAVIAHLRHTETDYDDLLVSGVERFEARQRVQKDITDSLSAWE